MKRRDKSLNFIVPLVIYPFEVMVSFGQTDEELLRVLDKFKIDHSKNYLFSSPSSGGTAKMFSSGQMLLRLRHLPGSTFDYGVLQHEIFHIVCFTMDRVGIHYDIEKSDEAFAYLIQFLTQQIYNKLKK